VKPSKSSKAKQENYKNSSQEESNNQPPPLDTVTAQNLTPVLAPVTSPAEKPTTTTEKVYFPPTEIPLPMSPVQETMDSLYPTPPHWEPLFNSSYTQTPIFISLMSVIFSHLDPKHTGFLPPESYSSFLEMEGYKTPENICK